MPRMTDGELTRLAATAVMAWQECAQCDIVHRPGSGCHKSNWSPLTDWRAAGEIIDKMRADGYEFEVNRKRLAFAGEKLRLIMMTEHNGNYPRAITIAALLATGAVTEEQV